MLKLLTTIFLLAVINDIAASKCLDMEINGRDQIHIFNYSGSTHSIQNIYSQFKPIIKLKLTTLLEELVSDHKNFFEYLKFIRILDKTNHNNIASIHQKYQYWEKYDLIEYMYGIVPIDGNDSFSKSNIYIGDLRGNFPRKEISIPLPLNDVAIKNAVDSHSIVTMYALAVDACKNGCFDRANKLLGKSYSKIQDIQIRTGPSTTNKFIGRLIPILVKMKSNITSKNSCP